MASDWIRMRSGLLTNPKVIRIARRLQDDPRFVAWWSESDARHDSVTVRHVPCISCVTRVTIGGLLGVWGAVNSVTDGDGFVRDVSSRDVDEMAGVPGFGDAMKSVGWVTERDDGLVFPNFGEHNTTEKERGSGAKTAAQRAKEYRDRKKSQTVTPRHVTESVTRDVTNHVTNHVTRHHREEKSREVLKEPPMDPPTGDKPKRACALPADFQPDATGEALAEKLGVDLAAELPKFCDHHRARGSTMKDWQAAWRTWARNAVRFGARSAPSAAAEPKPWAGAL